MAKSIPALIARGVSVLAFFVAAGFTTGNQIATLCGRTYLFSYTNWAFSVLFFTVNIIGGVYNSAIFFLPTESRFWPAVVCCDVILNQLLVGAIAAMGVGVQIFENGDIHLGWPAICPSVTNFCSRLVTALIASSIGLFFCFVLNCYTLGIALNPLLVPKTGGLNKPSSSDAGGGGGAGPSSGGGTASGGTGGSSSGGGGSSDQCIGHGSSWAGSWGSGGRWGGGDGGVYYGGFDPRIMY